MALKIGELLVKHGIVTEQQVAEALRAQQMYGGRVGTNLVELGFLSEQALARFLSNQLSLPCIELAEIDNIGAEVLRSVPQAIAEKYKVVPIALEKRKLRLAMADPTDLKAIDEVAFSTGLQVHPVVSPELLITFALEKYYGVIRKTRYIKLSGASDMEFQVVQTGQYADPDPSGAVKVEERHEFLQQQQKEFTAPRFTVPAAMQELARITDHAEVFEILRKYVAQDFERAAIFVVRGTTVSGWSQAGCALSDAQLRKVSFGTLESKLFDDAAVKKQVGWLPIPPGKIEDALVSNLGIKNRKEVLMVPVAVNNQVVSFLVAADRKLGDPDELVKSYDSLAKKISFAVQMSYLRKRILEGL